MQVFMMYDNIISKPNHIELGSRKDQYLRKAIILIIMLCNHMWQGKYLNKLENNFLVSSTINLIKRNVFPDIKTRMVITLSLFQKLQSLEKLILMKINNFIHILYVKEVTI